MVVLLLLLLEHHNVVLLWVEELLIAAASRVVDEVLLGLQELLIAAASRSIEKLLLIGVLLWWQHWEFLQRLLALMLLKAELIHLLRQKLGIVVLKNWENFFIKLLKFFQRQLIN